jgi:hypothetical protein
MKKNELRLLIREEIERLIKEQHADDIESISINTVGLTNRIYSIRVYNKNGTNNRYHDIPSFNKSFGTNIPIDGIRGRYRIQQDFIDALPNVKSIDLVEFDVS